jgi:hypothetical protein
VVNKDCLSIAEYCFVADDDTETKDSGAGANRKSCWRSISGVVNSSRVSSAFDPLLSSDSILIKWRSVSAVSGIGSWEPSSHTILSIPAGGVLVSWLVSLLSEEIKGFIVRGESFPLFFSLFLTIAFFCLFCLGSWHLGLHLSQQDLLSARSVR